MQTLILVLQMVPHLIDAMIAIEKAVQQSGAGASKLQLIRDVVAAVNEQEKNLPLDKIMPLIEKFAGLFVSLMNRLGIFKTTKQPT
jgi:hypothetical protein